MNAMPRYVEYGGRVDAPPPFEGRDGSFRLFVLQGGEKQIAKLCREVFTAPAGGAVEYRPLGSLVLLMTGSANLSSLAPGFTQMGYVRETQLSLWVPMMAGTTIGPVFVPERLCLAVPYIFVNNPMSYMGGREDYGFPKSMGIFEPADATGDAVTVQAFGGDFSPQNEARWLPLIEIAAVGTAASAPTVWTPLGDPAEIDLPEALAPVSQALGGVLAGTAQQVFLKQFRDCASATSACYQAVVEAPMQVEDVQWASLPGSWSVTVHPLDSHPIAAELGVGDQPALFTVALKMKMLALPGTVVG